jgi:hypothetical protein
MIPLIYGLITVAAVIAFAEIFRNIDLKFYASLNLAAIPFIYLGFSIEPHSLIFTIPGASFFLFFAYWGYKRNHLLIVAGLSLHGIWDILFPLLSTVAPHGYDIFCITVDLLLAFYFYQKLRRRRTADRASRWSTIPERGIAGSL